MAPARVDQVGATRQDAGLRAAEELVAGEDHERGARRDRLPHGGLVAQPGRWAGGQPGTRRVEEPGTQIDDDRWPERREWLDGCVLGEASDAVVRLVHLEDQLDIARDRLVVGGTRAVGGPDLDQTRPRLLHDLRDAETAADLDQLAPRDRDAASACESSKREQHGGRTVVDDEHCFGAARSGEQRSGMVSA